MAEVTTIGVDLAKRVFQLHGARADGSVAFRKKLSRDRFLSFLDAQPRCVVAMEACGTAHGWGREIEKLGHEEAAPTNLRETVRQAAQERRRRCGGSFPEQVLGVSERRSVHRIRRLFHPRCVGGRAA